MAYRIECDRCGDTEKVAAPSAEKIPPAWLQFSTLWLGEGEGNNTRKPIDGGVFCSSCVDDLRRWRERPPARLAESEFKRSA